MKSKPKPKPKRASKANAKNKGKRPPSSEFRAQLDGLGLKIIEVAADGNCFFRALADQLEGDEENHEKNRKMVTRYILENRAMFEPFIEDEVPFEEYCQSMEQDGTWAGNMELQAASLVTRSNICIHQHSDHRLYIRNFDGHGARMIHLSYHHGEHYNSVRLKEDPCEGPAMTITIKADVDVSEKSNQPKPAGQKSKDGHGQNIDEKVKLVMAGTACNNAEMVSRLLNDLDGDVDATIEVLIAEQTIEQSHDESYFKSESSYGNDYSIIANYKIGNHVDGDTIKSTHNEKKPRKDDKKIPRNQFCPCGSKRKYKDCCCPVTGNSSTKIASNQALNSNKNKKEWKNGKKGKNAKAAPAYFGKDNAVPPDMGALCI